MTSSGDDADVGRWAVIVPVGPAAVETERLHDLFDPIRQKMIEDYAAIRQGRYSSKDADTRRDLLMPGLFSLPNVDSMMLADQKGGHLLVLRYSEPVRRSSLLKSVSARLPVRSRARRMVWLASATIWRGWLSWTSKY